MRLGLWPFTLLPLAGAACLWWSYRASWGLGVTQDRMVAVSGAEVMPVLLVLAGLAIAAAMLVANGLPVAGWLGAAVLFLVGLAAGWLGWFGAPVLSGSGIENLTSCSGSNDLCEIVAWGRPIAVLAGVLLLVAGSLVAVRVRRA